MKVKGRQVICDRYRTLHNFNKRFFVCIRDVDSYATESQLKSLVCFSIASSITQAIRKVLRGNSQSHTLLRIWFIIAVGLSIEILFAFWSFFYWFGVVLLFGFSTCISGARLLIASTVKISDTIFFCSVFQF